MKRAIFLGALCTLLCLSAAAQSERQRFSYSAEAGIGIPFSTPKATPALVRLAAYYNPGCRWELGAGTGVSLIDKTALIPLFGEVRFGLTRPHKFTPYLSCAVGHSFAPASGVDGGFLLSPAVGVKWMLKPRLRGQLAVGYESQGLARLKYYSDAWFDYGFREELVHHSLTIRAGVTF